MSESECKVGNTAQFTVPTLQLLGWGGGGIQLQDVPIHVLVSSNILTPVNSLETVSGKGGAISHLDEMLADRKIRF